MKSLLLIALALTALLPTARPEAQVGINPPIPPSWNQRPGQTPTPNVPGLDASAQSPTERMQREQLSKLNLSRQAQARSDAARLLELATELKRQLDDTGNATVSARTNGDADQIIKLAKSIKSKMQPY